jgi:hypothetical protein
MKTKNLFKLIASATLSLVAVSPVLSQANLGAACGCPAVASRPDVIVSSMAGYVAVSGTYGGELTNGAAFTCANNYILDKKIYIPANKTLTIEPGTVIKGADNSVAAEKTALIIERGGKIIANGTESCPIVFTAQADPMDGTYLIKNSQKWGGIVVLGKATNNLKAALNGPFTAGSGNGKLCVTGSDGLGVVEGFATSNPQDQFGVNTTGGGSFDDNDNSGIMKYVSIRHGGAILAVGSEINGLTLASVGRGTTIENIEIVSCGDDNIEIFGGTVNLKYCTTIFGNDDMFDFDLGWTGKAQFLFGMKTPWSASTVAPVFGTITLASGAITNIAVTTGGSGFSSTTPPTVTISGGTGSGATATATVNGSGVITGLTITNGGTGYTVTTGITVTVGLDNLSADNDNGFEGDSDDQSSNYLPKSHPVIYNATIMGNGKSTGSADNRGLSGVNLKDGAEGEIYNSVFANFKNGLNLQTTFGGTRTEGDSWQNWSTSAGPASATAGNGTESVKFKCNTFVGVSKTLTKNASVINGTTSTTNTAADITQFFTTDKNDSVASLPGFDFTFALTNPATSNAITTANDVVPNPALSVTGCPTAPVDGFFTPAKYRGAFSSVAGENWLSNWTYSQVIGATKGVKACPTDLDGDGDTDVDDFTIFAPKFATNCN